MNEGTVVKQYDFDKPDIHWIDYFFDDIVEGCRNKYFQTIENRLVYDIKLTKIFNNEEVNFTITHRSIEFETEFYGLNKKMKNARRNGFIFIHINNLTIKVYSNLSNINICFYLKNRIPVCHRQFFKILSQNPEYVKTHCNDLNILFLFACRMWFKQLN